MMPEILIVDADRYRRTRLCRVLHRHRFQTLALTTLTQLEEHLAAGSSRTVIIDLDSLPADKRFFKRMRRSHPFQCCWRRWLQLRLRPRCLHPSVTC